MKPKASTKKDFIKEYQTELKRDGVSDLMKYHAKDAPSKKTHIKKHNITVVGSPVPVVRHSKSVNAHHSKKDDVITHHDTHKQQQQQQHKQHERVHAKKDNVLDSNPYPSDAEHDSDPVIPSEYTFIFL